MTTPKATRGGAGRAGRRGPARWCLEYRREWLRADVVAGLTAAAIVIPKAMAYAVIAGSTVEAGLYTALAAMLVYPLLGSSRPLSVSTTSAIAMLTAAAVGSVAGPGAGPGSGAVAATLALLVGGVLVVARLPRLGFVAKFISKPVLVGFEAGVGIVILIGQLKSVLGAHLAARTTIGTLSELPGAVAHAHVATVLVAGASAALLLALPRVVPRLPAPLVVLALSIVASAALGLERWGVALVGTVPSGLPSLALPDLTLAGALWPAALGIALMSFTESVAAARAFRRPEDAPIEPNGELLAIGAANLASSLMGGLPAGGGASQTAVADSAGARSQLAQWVNAVAVLATVLLLSRTIGLLPQPALGAVILVAAVSMIKPRTFLEIGRVRRTELAWALATVGGVVVAGTLDGILIAVAISVMTLLYQANHPPVYVVAYDREHDAFCRAGDHEGDETFPGLLMVRTEGRLTFANTDLAAEKMHALVASSDARVLVLECGAIPDIEYTALVQLAEGEQSLQRHGVTLWLAAVNPDLLRTIRRSPLGRALGEDRIFPNLYKAVAAWRRTQQADPRPEGRLA